MQKSCSNYPVEFVEDVFGESPVLAEVLRKVTGSDEPRILIVADMNVVQRTEGLGSKIGRYVQAHNIQLAGKPVVMSGGEKIKADNMQSALLVVSAILSAKLGRNDVVLAIGGGTILDVAGYAAAQTRGGVKIVRMPTTPTAMMDAAFADFAAVDSSTVKNAMRVPSIPAAVVCDTAFARTVLDGVWRGGISEAVRLAVASDAALMKKLVKLAPAYHDRDMDALREIVTATYATRKKKGSTDFAIWSALRLESMSNYKLPHGYAVSIGICIDLGYAAEAGIMKAADRESVMKVLRDCGALDGVVHSQHLINNSDNLMFGLDAWSLSAGEMAVPMPTEIGKSQDVLNPDRDIFKKVLRELVDSLS